MIEALNHFWLGFAAGIGFDIPLIFAAVYVTVAALRARQQATTIGANLADRTIFQGRGRVKPELPSFVCPDCGMRSYHPKDVEHSFCVRCGKFHGDRP